MRKFILLISLLLTFCVDASAQTENVEVAIVNGFRVCVFNGTQQDARTLASGAVGTVRKHYADMETKMIYDAPVFKVLVGVCLNRIEATMLLAKLRALFPNSFIVNDKIQLTDFVGVPSIVSQYSKEGIENIDETVEQK